MPRWKDAAFSARSADLYEGIADTFVQLFASRSAGLIARIRDKYRKSAIWQKTKPQSLRGHSKESAPGSSMDSSTRFCIWLTRARSREKFFTWMAGLRSTLVAFEIPSNETK